MIIVDKHGTEKTRYFDCQMCGRKFRADLTDCYKDEGVIFCFCPDCGAPVQEERKWKIL